MTMVCAVCAALLLVGTAFALRAMDSGGLPQRRKMNAIEAVCPTCRAAAGAKCTEPVRDGSRHVDSFHQSRIDVADTFSRCAHGLRKTIPCVFCVMEKRAKRGSGI